MEVFISLLLITSISVNIMFYWFIKRLFSRSSLLESNTTTMLESLNQFHSHLETVHELRQYYGDPQLNELVDHTNEVAEEIENYRNGFIFETRGAFIGDNDQEDSQEE